MDSAADAAPVPRRAPEDPMGAELPFGSKVSDFIVFSKTLCNGSVREIVKTNRGLL